MFGPNIDISIIPPPGPFTLDSTYGPGSYAPPAGLEYTVLHPTYGAQTYMLVFNNTGTAFAVGVGLEFVSGSYINAELAPTNSPTSKAAGVVQVIIPDQSYGWALKRGTGIILAEAGTTGIAQDARIRVTAATGDFDDTAIAADAQEVWGVATAAIATGATGVARLSIP